MLIILLRDVPWILLYLFHFVFINLAELFLQFLINLSIRTKLDYFLCQRLTKIDLLRQLVTQVDVFSFFIEFDIWLGRFPPTRCLNCSSLHASLQELEHVSYRDQSLFGET